MRKNDAFDIIKNISKYGILVQLMDSLGNTNYAISIVGHCIFDSNYKKALSFTQKCLDIICSPSVGEEQVTAFRSVFFAVRYIWAPTHIKKDKHDTFN